MVENEDDDPSSFGAFDIELVGRLYRLLASALCDHDAATQITATIERLIDVKIAASIRQGSRE
jgi:hypothetical protein